MVFCPLLRYCLSNEHSGGCGSGAVSVQKGTRISQQTVCGFADFDERHCRGTCLSRDTTLCTKTTVPRL